MARKTHEQRDFFEEQWFTDHAKNLDNIEDKLDKNSIISQKALDEALKTNSRVTHLEADVKENLAEAHKISKRALTRANRTSTRLIDLEKVIIPGKPPEPENLPIWYKDPKIIKVLVYVAAAVILSAVGLNITEVFKQ